MNSSAAEVQRIVDTLYRSESGRITAPLIRILGSFALAEEVVQDAFVEALRRWEQEGIPETPVAWLHRVAKNRAIDRYRRQGRWREREAALADPSDTVFDRVFEPDEVRDDMLRLIFTCCHPSLAVEAQIALTLRTVCGLSTDQVAKGFLLQPTTLAQRLVRAKKKIELAAIPYVVPSGRDLAPRLSSVLRTVYLVFNEGYGASDGDALVRHDLCKEAIRLARLLHELLPAQSEPLGALALMLLHDSRRDTRVDTEGHLVPLDEQDRTRWDKAQIEEALPMVERALSARPVSGYAIEAAIAALHARAETPEDTDWEQIASLYAVLESRSGGSPVVALNRAVAIALAGELERGLEMLDALDANGSLSHYHLLPAARADLLRRSGRIEDARKAYSSALELAENEVERRFISRRLSTL
ncbi:MAG: RNA polymerase sigma factor [Myxococcota bacterium]